MDPVESLRKSCLKQQTELRSLLTDIQQFDKAIRHLLSHHAMLHAKELAPIEHRSLADEVLSDVPDGQMRQIPRIGEHSVAWLI